MVVFLETWVNRASRHHRPVFRCSKRPAGQVPAAALLCREGMRGSGQALRSGAPAAAPQVQSFRFRRMGQARCREQGRRRRIGKPVASQRWFLLEMGYRDRVLMRVMRLGFFESDGRLIARLDRTI